jgi:tetratricopeptide (TPR) repeat protein
MHTFISHNGMEALGRLVDSDNLYLRGQVLEIILTATDCDVYDWFKPPESYADKLLHQNMLGFGRSASVLYKLFANRTDSYPGGAFRALQIIAFLVSWMRALYTSDQKLQLSPQALSELRQWAAKEPPQAPTAGAGAETQGEAQSDPEVQLANALLDDFTSEMNMGATSGSGGSTALPQSAENQYLLTALDASSLAAPEGGTLPTAVEHTREVQEETAPPTSAHMQDTTLDAQASVKSGGEQLSVQVLKDRGNACFKEGQYVEAREWYVKALGQMPVPVLDGDRDHKSAQELQASLHANAATAMWKLAQAQLATHPELELAIGSDLSAGSAEAESDKREALATLQSALRDCKQHCLDALCAQPGNCKAAYRLASVLLLQQLPREALEATLACLRVSNGGSAPASEDSDREVLQQMRRRCAAAALLEQHDAAKLGKSPIRSEQVDLGMTPQARTVLRSLLVQYQIEVDLPAEVEASDVTRTTGSGVTPPNTTVDAKRLAVGSAVTSTGKPSGKEEKPKKKKAAMSGTKSLAQRLQEVDDNMLESLMKRGGIKS